jgi:hypothetical protein
VRLGLRLGLAPSLLTSLWSLAVVVVGIDAQVAVAAVGIVNLLLRP